MAFLDYTNPIPLPAPLTSGTTVQSYTDPIGEVWVAKNGVNSGQWRKARDVLHCKLWRNAAFTLATSGNPILPMDTVNRDPYGMFNSGVGGANAPIAGIYRIVVWYRYTATAAGQSANAFIAINNATLTSFGNGGASQTTSGTFTPSANDTLSLSAGDYVTLNQNCTAALGIVAGALQNSGLVVDYLGTG